MDSHSKVIFCDQSNISTSRAYINNALTVRGLLHDEESQLKFNSADAPAVINVIYDFLRKSEQNDTNKEALSAKLRELSAENDRLVASETKANARIEALQHEVGALKNHLAHAKDDLTKTSMESKQLRDTLAKTTAALNYTKIQVSHDLRKRDTQIMRMKEHIADGGAARRSKATSFMTVRTGATGSSNGPPMTASYATYDPSLQASVAKEMDDHLIKLAHDVSRENDQLAELLQATLASLDSLIQIEEEEHPMFSSTSQSVIMLEAQLKVRLTALRDMLDMPNYVPLEEVETRDAKIKDLQQKLMRIETEWGAAQSVLKGLTASVLEKTSKDTVTTLGEWSEGKKNAEQSDGEGMSLLRQDAKTPKAISKELGNSSKSTVKIDSRLLQADFGHRDFAVEIESTPVRARKEKFQRRNRRQTIGLGAKEEDLNAELEEYLKESPKEITTPTS